MNSFKSLAVMQPYFLPYLGYFSLVESVDHFIFFDDVQYQRKSWMSRNHLQNIETGETFFIRPSIIKPKYREYLPNVSLNNDETWKNKLLEQLKGYKNKVDYYPEAQKLLSSILEIKTSKLATYNMESIKLICNILEIKTEFSEFSDHDFKFDTKPSASTWGFEIARKMRVTSYINAPGGQSFIKAKPFISASIQLGFIQPILELQTASPSFIPGLSIIDLVAFIGIDETKKAIKNYTIKWINNEDP